MAQESGQGGSNNAGAAARQTSTILIDAESLFRSGEMLKASDLACSGEEGDRNVSARLRMLRGMALFEIGDVVRATELLDEACLAAQGGGPSLECATALARFSRRAQFQSPEEALPGLSELRLFVAAAGDLASLSNLHLVVARLEACRGLCANAARHLEISRQLALRVDQPGLQAGLELVESSLGMYGGNLDRALAAARRGLELATLKDLRWALAASATNLGFLALCSGNVDRARRYLDGALRASGEMSFVRLGALDNLAQVSLYVGEAKAAAALLDQCAETIASQRLPARSWYDLAHQLTRCAYLESLQEWPGVLEIAESTEPELARRQFRALRTSLLCAKARALAHLEKHHHAESTLATAVRVCPRGATDPLIILEASLGLCRALAGDHTRGAVHFDRALAGCRAIGHRYHETWIDRCRQTAIPDRRAGTAIATPAVDRQGTALVLADVSAILGAGHSVDLLAHRLTAILEHTALAPRLRVESEPGRPYRAESSAEYRAAPDGACTIRLRGSDRRITIHIRDVHSLEDIALLKNVVDLVQAAVRRTADAEADDGQQHLWPEATPASGDDTVFQSPRMVELLRVAMRLAADPRMTILITGETGTGKEVLARFIHESSPSARGPFVPFNCATMPRDLVESQLFGHRRGAFTGAVESFPGVIRSAERGTLFLDEIGDLDPAVQPKFLRFLESGEIHPVGDTKPLNVRVRVVAATNADLNAQVAQNRFRSDLFYRIGTAPLALPPLRERKDEIPALATLFLDRYCRESERRDLHLGDDFIAALLLYDWPGNIRQLGNEIRRVVAMASDGDTLRSTSLTPEITRSWNVRPTATDADASVVTIRLDQNLAQATADLERRFIEHALTSSGNRVNEAAQLLGLSRKGLFLKRRRQGLLGK
jgi:transcriptional regulator with GAF, ATPase, and Fis domain/tetratricopeptide (TPR) repeat protein